MDRTLPQIKVAQVSKVDPSRQCRFVVTIDGVPVGPVMDLDSAAFVSEWLNLAKGPIRDAVMAARVNRTFFEAIGLARPAKAIPPPAMPALEAPEVDEKTPPGGSASPDGASKVSHV